MITRTVIAKCDCLPYAPTRSRVKPCPVEVELNPDDQQAYHQLGRLGWATPVEDGEQKTYCGPCARARGYLT